MSAPAASDALVFAALGDPTRLDLLHRLGTGGAATATVLADPLPVTRQAVSRHLQVLATAGLVRTHKAGRDVLYAVDPTTLTERAAWLDAQARAWGRRLADVRDRAEQDPG